MVHYHDYIDPCHARTSINISNVCNQTIVKMEVSIIPVLDATAKIPSGIFLGNAQWLGSHSECVKVSATSQTTPQTQLFTGKYCKAVLYELPGESNNASTFTNPNLGPSSVSH